ncbi:cytosine permease [Escherichia coli]
MFSVGQPVGLVLCGTGYCDDHLHATGNIIPAGYQIAAIAPTKLTYKNGVLIASIISLLICPWKLMENQDSIYLFLEYRRNACPVIGKFMMAHYFVDARNQS